MAIESIIAAISATAAVASAGVGAASAAGALGPEKPKIELPEAPKRSDPAIEAARRRQLAAEGKTRSPSSNYLTGGGNLGSAPVSTKYLTGQ